jgi:hypothetical protein
MLSKEGRKLRELVVSLNGFKAVGPMWSGGPLTDPDISDYVTHANSNSEALVSRLQSGLNNGRSVVFAELGSNGVKLLDTSVFNYRQVPAETAANNPVIDSSVQFDAYHTQSERWDRVGMPHLHPDTMSEPDTILDSVLSRMPPVMVMDWTTPYDKDTARSLAPNLHNDFYHWSEDPDRAIRELLSWYSFGGDYIPLGPFSLRDVGVMWQDDPGNLYYSAIPGWTSMATPYDARGYFYILLLPPTPVDFGSVRPQFSYSIRSNMISGVEIARTAKGFNRRVLLARRDEADKYRGSKVIPNALELAETLDATELLSTDGYMKTTPMYEVLLNENHADGSSDALWESPNKIAGYYNNLLSFQRSHNEVDPDWLPIDAVVDHSYQCNESIGLKFTSEDWYYTFANGFFDVSLVNADFSLSASGDDTTGNYSVMTATPSRVNARVTSDTLVDLLEDVKNEPGRTSTEVANLRKHQTSLREHPCIYSCTFYGGLVLPPSSGDIEGTKLWQYVQKEDPEKITEDLGEGMTLQKAKDKLHKARADGKSYYAVTHCVETGEAVDDMFSDSGHLDAIADAAVITIAKQTEPLTGVVIDYDGIAWIPTDLELQYVMAMHSPVYSDTTESEQVARLGLNGNWKAETADILTAGEWSERTSWSAPGVHWSYLGQESFLTQDGFPRIDFSDDDSRYRALLAYKGLRDDGSSFFTGSFFPG